ncbi:hypothetical protein IV04_15150 [Serratia sp. Ag1]|nr:hypothetical protein JV45_01215 [Serratia sp. Ag2]KFK98220.1 hypothetical protein IV04_15150 [Serratia sp. Ag1]
MPGIFIFLKVLQQRNNKTVRQIGEVNKISKRAVMAVYKKNPAQGGINVNGDFYTLQKRNNTTSSGKL